MAKSHDETLSKREQVSNQDVKVLGWRGVGWGTFELSESFFLNGAFRRSHAEEEFHDTQIVDRLRDAEAGCHDSDTIIGAFEERSQTLSRGMTSRAPSGSVSNFGSCRCEVRSFNGCSHIEAQ